MKKQTLKILECIQKNTKTIKEISNETKIPYPTVVNKVNSLEKEGIVSKDKKYGGKVIFNLGDSESEESDDTVFSAQRFDTEENRTKIDLVRAAVEDNFGKVYKIFVNEDKKDRSNGIYNIVVVLDIGDDRV